MKKLITIQDDVALITPLFSFAQNSTVNLQVKESNGQPIPLPQLFQLIKKDTNCTDAQGKIYYTKCRQFNHHH